jgi:hypothetical protein
MAIFIKPPTISCPLLLILTSIVKYEQKDCENGFYARIPQKERITSMVSVVNSIFIMTQLRMVATSNQWIICSSLVKSFRILAVRMDLLKPVRANAAFVGGAGGDEIPPCHPGQAALALKCTCVDFAQIEILSVFGERGGIQQSSHQNHDLIL